MGDRKLFPFIVGTLVGLGLLAGPGCAPASADSSDSTEAPVSQAFLAGQGLSDPISIVRDHGPIKTFFSLLLGLYSEGVSPADGPTCAFAPTCAGYAGTAIHRHGLAEGILLTGDRLMRCNGYDKSVYPIVGSERHYFDPVP